MYSKSYSLLLLEKYPIAFIDYPVNPNPKLT